MRAPAHAGARTAAQPHRRASGRPFFDGLDLVAPGMRVLPSFRPDAGGAACLATDVQVSGYSGVVRKR